MARILALAALFAAAVSALPACTPVSSTNPDNHYPLDPHLPGRPENHHGTITGGDGDIWFDKNGVLNLQGEGETNLLLTYLHAGGHLIVDPLMRDGKLAELVIKPELPGLLPGLLGKLNEIRIPIKL